MAYLDRVVAQHQAVRLEAGEHEGVDEFLQRHAVLQAERDGDGEVVHQRAKAAPSLCMSMKISPSRAVLIFAGAQIDLVAADDGLLGVALAAVRQLRARAHGDALDDLLDDLLGDARGARGRRLAR